LAGETEQHRRLKEAACWWLWNQGFRAVAAEVPMPGIGVIDAAAVGRPGGVVSRSITCGTYPSRPHAGRGRAVWQAVFIECKATRADFLREAADGEQIRTAIRERRRLALSGSSARPFRRLRRLGKFAVCLARPTANVHWLLTPPALLRRDELPPRWGLLELSRQGVVMVVPAKWQEARGLRLVEAAIARTLTAAIYAADTRAVTNTLNRLLRQKQADSARRMVRSLNDLASM